MGITTSKVAADLVSLVFQMFRDEIYLEKSGTQFHVSQFASFKPEK
jgi:hypothetical protein